ncbi:unnamed protein product [marine sediment metagenome]|uniref:Uncharacterized protein n=1 Tax=marine sediment metagenome TaxID=412755 RepID=X0V382_9ZZZZ
MCRRVLWVLAVVLFGSVAMVIQGGGPSEIASAQPPKSSGGRDRPPRTARMASELTKEQEAELLKALKEKLPGRYEALIKLREEKPRAYRWALRGTWRWYQRWKNLPEEVQKAAIVEQAERMQIVRILKAIGEAKDPAEKARLKKDLTESVARQFDAEQKRHRHHLQELKEQIRRLEEELRRRIEDRDKMIQQRLERYLTEGPPGRFRRGPGTRPADKTRGRKAPK